MNNIDFLISKHESINFIKRGLEQHVTKSIAGIKVLTENGISTISKYYWVTDGSFYEFIFLTNDGFFEPLRYRASTELFPEICLINNIHSMIKNLIIIKQGIIEEIKQSTKKYVLHSKTSSDTAKVTSIYCYGVELLFLVITDNGITRSIDYNTLKKDWDIV